MSHDENEMLPEGPLARLSPLLDGELPEAEAAELRAAVARDPDLARARSRLEALTRLSRAVLRAAPLVTAAEWRARGERILALAPARSAIVGEARVLSLRTALVRFAVAAAFLFATSLSIPLLAPAPEGGEPSHGRLPISRAPGANQFEVMEAWNNRTDYYIWLDYPSEPEDTVVIMVSKV